MARRQSSIKKRVRTVIFAASVSVLFITALAFVINDIFSFRDQVFRNVSTLAAVIADNSNAPLNFDNVANAEEILGALKAESDIEAAAVYDAKGDLFAAYPPGLATNLLPAQVEAPGHHFGNNALVVFQTISSKEKKPSGTLYIRSSLRGLSERFWQYGLIVAAVLGGALAAAYLLSAALQSRISYPILALTNATEAIARRGDYSVRAPKVTDDELGAFTDAFNRMLDQIQGDQARLAEQARLLDLSTDAINMSDVERRIKYWNKGSEELYGFTRLDAMGKVTHELLQTEFSEPLEAIGMQLYSLGRWSGEVVHTKKDGAKLHVSSRWSLNRNAAGEIVSILESNRDISERKRFEASLERLVAERTARLQETIGELEAFSYSISHDMRAPLRAMQGYAKVLLADYGPALGTEAIGFLERIVRGSNRLDLLVQDVLAYSKVAKGDIALHPVDLERLIDDILPNHPELQPPRANILLDRPILPVIGHEAYVTQCVTNLLGNAVKFVSEGLVPEIRVRTERLDENVRIWFEDNGIGIAPAHQERIFEIFGQVHAEKRYGGTGIGLAIVRKAVQRMNGAIGVESEPGQGSRFWIILQAPKT